MKRMERNLIEPHARHRWLGVGLSALMVWALPVPAGAQVPPRQREALEGRAGGAAPDSAGTGEVTNRSSRSGTAQGAQVESEASAERTQGTPPWLKWPLAGLGVASAITSVTAWQVRDRFAEHWNSDACLRDGQTRIQVCSHDYDDGRDTELVAWVSGVASLVFIGGAVSSWLLEKPAQHASSVSTTTCGVSGWGAVCSGSF